jgi:AcrR family transcriptional regulator
LNECSRKFPVAKPGRHVEGAQTRERILSVAATLLAQQGYAATSISQICKAADALPASIYWAFGSKEGLFAAVMERQAEVFFEALPNIARTDLAAEADQMTRMFEEKPEFLRLMLVLSLERRDGDPAILEAARRVRRHAIERIAATLAPTVTLDDPQRVRAICEEAARFSLMLFDGAFIARQIDADPAKMHELFLTVAIGLRAMLDHLTAQARAQAPRRAPARRKR